MTEQGDFASAPVAPADSPDDESVTGASSNAITSRASEVEGSSAPDAADSAAPSAEPNRSGSPDALLSARGTPQDDAVEFPAACTNGERSVARLDVSDVGGADDKG